MPALGDINGDGVSNNLDAIILFNWTLNNGLEIAHPERSDVQINGIINNLDAIVLFNWTLNNMPVIPFSHNSTPHM